MNEFATISNKKHVIYKPFHRNACYLHKYRVSQNYWSQKESTLIFNQIGLCDLPHQWSKKAKKQRKENKTQAFWNQWNCDDTLCWTDFQILYLPHRMHCRSWPMNHFFHFVQQMALCLTFCYRHLRTLDYCNPCYRAKFVLIGVRESDFLIRRAPKIFI